MTAMRCLLLLGALRAATALAPEAVEALLSIGDGERLSYLDVREALHNEWSRNVSAPAVAAVRVAHLAEPVVGARTRARVRAALRDLARRDDDSGL